MNNIALNIQLNIQLMRIKFNLQHWARWNLPGQEPTEDTDVDFKPKINLV